MCRRTFSWPEWNGQPLAFLGQIELAEISANPIAKPLPSHGLIAFFYDCEQSTWGFDRERQRQLAGLLLFKWF